MAVIALDFDGTLVYPKWPGIGEEYPGAVEGVKALLAAGHSAYIFTSRCWDPDDSSEFERRALHQRWAIQDWLTDRDLPLRVVAKSPYDIIVDDKALRHPPRRNAWKHTPARILAQVERART